VSKSLEEMDAPSATYEENRRRDHYQMLDSPSTTGGYWNFNFTPTITTNDTTTKPNVGYDP